MDLSVKLTVHSKRLLSESRRYEREEKKAALALRRAARAGKHAEARMAAEKQASSKIMYERYARLSVLLDQAAGMVRTMATTKQISDTMARVTQQLLSAAHNNDAVGIETQLSNFNATMEYAASATQQMESTLDRLGGSHHSGTVGELMQRAYDEAGIELEGQFIPPPCVLPAHEQHEDEEEEQRKPAAL